MIRLLFFLALTLFIFWLFNTIINSGTERYVRRVETKRRENWVPGMKPLEPPPFGHHWSYDVYTERWEAKRDDA